MISDSTRPSLRKKMSGTFWKRKSSLGASFAAGDQEHTNGHTGSPATNGQAHTTISEESRPATPVLGDESPRMKKRRSGIFWRRKSNLTLAGTLNAEKQGWGSKQSESGINENGNENAKIDTVQVERKLSEKHSPPPPPRSYSPPPQLPEFIGGGGDLDLGEDFFKDIQ